jgi:hypothetical protein
VAQIHKAVVALALGLAVTAGVSPALAKGHAEAGYNGGGYPITEARAAALRVCSGGESRFVEYNWGVSEIDNYRACMAEHGQPE